MSPCPTGAAPGHTDFASAPTNASFLVCAVYVTTKSNEMFTVRLAGCGVLSGLSIVS